MSKRTFLVEIDASSRIPTKILEEYIADAVGGWCGSFHPDDPIHATLVEVMVLRATSPRLRRLLASMEAKK